jgi:hypothetical protein
VFACAREKGAAVLAPPKSALRAHALLVAEMQHRIRESPSTIRDDHDEQRRRDTL